MKYITPKELLDWGLLFEINRGVLHPFGLALAVEMDENGENVVFSNDVWDCRDDPEGIIYGEDAFSAGYEKFMTFLETQGYSILDKRLSTLGYMDQTDLDFDNE